MPKRRANNGYKPEYQWYGGFGASEVETQASTSPSDLVQLRPAHLSLDADRSVVIKRVILHWNISRLAIGNVQVFGWQAGIMDVDSAGNLTDKYEMFSGDPFVPANKAIIQRGSLPWPGTLLTSLDVRDFIRDGLAVTNDFKVNRKIDLGRQAVVLQVNADVSGVLFRSLMWRVLVQTS